MPKPRPLSKAAIARLCGQFADLIRIHGIQHSEKAINAAYNNALRKITGTAKPLRKRGRPKVDEKIAEIAWFMMQAHMSRSPKTSVAKAAEAIAHREGILNGYSVRTLRSFYAVIEKRHEADPNKGAAERKFLNTLKPVGKLG